jgi:hypothetical protein
MLAALSVLHVASRGSASPAVGAGYTLHGTRRDEKALTASGVAQHALSATGSGGGVGLTACRGCTTRCTCNAPEASLWRSSVTPGRPWWVSK